MNNNLSSKSEKYGLSLSNMDFQTDPSVDFYKYANGGWQAANPLPADYARYGTFDVLREKAREQLKDLIINLGDSTEATVRDSIAQKISDLYKLGMDEERRNREGASPLMPYIELIENFKREDFTNILAKIHAGMSSSFFSTGVGPDYTDSDINIMHIGEVGLGLGDRDYYLEENERNAEIMNAYEKYIRRLMQLIGKSEDETDRIWKTFIRTETEFARHKMSREEKRDPMNTYHMMFIDELESRYPGLEWKKYFSLLGVRDIRKANVSSPDFMEFLSSYLPSLSERELKDIMLVNIVHGSAGLLSDDFEEASFEMFDRTMSGIEKMEPRWKRAMAIPNSMFGEAVGRLYVQKYFPEENKKYVLGLVKNLRTALAQHLSNLSWMSETTKTRALDKLEALKVKIGYPDKWKDYTELHIDPSLSYQENVLKASEWFVADNYRKMDQPVDKEEWHMYPQTVNAYYSPISNEICFPAGILQPPYFDINADDALNYGAIGVVIGHEMTHGFDDSGRKFDKNGNMVDWWLPEDDEKFRKLTDGLVRQFDEVEVAPGVHCNGRFTLGENIADQGGLRIALSAYRDFVNGDKPDDIEGFTPLQRFYVSYANVWADNIREEEKLSRTQSDPHSLGKNRVNVTLRNIAEFMEAFDIGEGSPMWRPEEERLVIW